jgi:2-polyprenyl-6-methoxyphenol hydroxylase-like FAD-dependent oxidoreductase
MTSSQRLQCCIAGGGPAGMMLGYLLARAGVETVVLEKHNDFLRDFRGDTVHPSTLQAMADLGLVEDFLECPHSELRWIGAEIDGKVLKIAQFDHLPVDYPFVAFVPQWDFLNFLADRGKKLPSLRVMMQTTAMRLIEDNGRVAGVHARTLDGDIEIRADLTVGADGRASLLRDQSGLVVKDLGAPIDVFWFRLSRDRKNEDQLLARVNNGRFIITIDRGDYWQCAFVIPKGGADKARRDGIEALRSKIAQAAPFLAGKVGELASFDDIKLLTVAVNRLERWSRAGLLFIGDAAHAMSPIGGVGINLAVQDAVAAANLLAAPLAAGRALTDDDLDAVRLRRLMPTRVIQRFQVLVQNRVMKPGLGDGADARINARPLELVGKISVLGRLAARMIGLGVRLERVRSPNVAARR